jgi:transcriptional regulator with GAF, ATPase, and Fis domain
MRCRLTVASRRAGNSARNFVHWGEHEQSVLAYPLMFQTRVAGSLLIACAQPDAFSEVHHKLIECYAHLMALAFEPDAFFDLKNIALRIMPPSSRQEPFFSQFRQRVFQTARCQCLTLSKAQERVWQEIEEELIQLAATEL